MDDSRTIRAIAVPAPRKHVDADPIQVTCAGVGSPPITVLARVTHVFCADTAADAWASVRSGVVSPGDLVLLRVARGAAEEWTELLVTGPEG